MCGRFTVKATWAELVALYRLTMDVPPHNLRPRYNPTDPIDVVTGEDGKRELGTMRWGLVPWWSSTNVMIGGHALLVGLTEILRN